MKNIFLFVFLFSMGLKTAEACPNVSGDYVSTNPEIDMSYTIVQNENDKCNITILFRNGNHTHKLFRRADNIAYKRTPEVYNNLGELVTPFAVAQSQTNKYIRAFFTGTTLNTNRVGAYFGKEVSQCPENVGLVENCDFTQIQLGFLANGKMIETRNGYYYSEGNHIALVREFEK